MDDDALGGIGSQRRRGGSHDRNGLGHRGEFSELQSYLRLPTIGDDDIRGHRNESWCFCPQAVFARVNVAQTEAALLITLALANHGRRGLQELQMRPNDWNTLRIENLA
jgi:hypothetical protein